MFGSLRQAGDLGQLPDVRQAAGRVGLADATGDCAVFGKRVFEREADHRVRGGAHVEIAQIPPEDRVGVLAVEIIRVDDGERGVYGV